MRVAIKESYFDQWVMDQIPDAYATKPLNIFTDSLGNKQRQLFWNPIGGTCRHFCSYCSMKYLDIGTKGKPFLHNFIDFNVKKPSIIQVEFDEGDMWGDWISNKWITKILRHCNAYKAVYVFMTKNPKRYHKFISQFPEKTILGATIETNKSYRLSKAPNPKERMEAMSSLSSSMTKVINIAPIVDFDVTVMTSWMQKIKPYLIRFIVETYGAKIPRPPLQKCIKLLNEVVEIADFVVVEPLNLIVGGRNPIAKLDARETFALVEKKVERWGKINNGENFANEKATRGG